VQLPKATVVIYPRRAVRVALRERCRQEKTTTAEVVMDAVQATHDDGRLAAAYAPRLPKDGLFKRKPRVVVDRDNVGDTSMVSFQLDRDNLEVIDQLWPDMGASSRNKFLDTALALHLNVDPDA
jgi:hypothetical protein